MAEDTLGEDEDEALDALDDDDAELALEDEVDL